MEGANVHISAGDSELEGHLSIPLDVKGLVIFAHGSGSGRHSPRNQFVARELHKHSLGTLLVDLLTEAEDANYHTRFDIPLLTDRLVVVTHWAAEGEQTKSLPMGYFGASTGAAAAMLAAVKEARIRALVSRGGRVDLAAEVADELSIPTMFIVGQSDVGVRESNQAVFSKLQCTKEIVEIPGATHLFEEPGALEEVAKHAARWFSEYLASKLEVERKSSVQ